MAETTSGTIPSSTSSNLGNPAHEWATEWVTRIHRSELGTPLLPAEYVASLGPGVRLIDIRDPQEFIGPLGYIPGSDWIPIERIESLPERLDPGAPLVLVSAIGERASDATRKLEVLGMRHVAALAGGVAHWRSLGFNTTRDPSILDRCDLLRTIARPASAESHGRGLTIEQVETHLGNPLSVRWIKLAALVLHTQLSCIDGRGDRGILGTPGGDAGQFLLALAAIETVLGRSLDADVIAALLARRIDALGGFYKHSDQNAIQAAAASMREDPRLQAAVAEYGADPAEWRQFLRRPPLLLREAVLEHLCQPRAIGCGHIRLMYLNAADYRLRPSLVIDFLRAFFEARWEGAFRAEYESLHGRHDERAVVNTRIEGALLPFTPVPLVSPSSFDCQMFVCHPQVSDYLMALLIDFLLLQTDLVPEFAKDIRPALLAEIKTLGAIHVRNSLHHLAQGLPIYDVVFANGGHVWVEFSGVVS
jgi:rhodanese-related sulfurtransferase